MQRTEGEGSRSHVINEIKRISIANDRKDFWNWIALVGLFCVLAAGLLYYFL